jgi:hypothetical protein
MISVSFLNIANIRVHGAMGPADRSVLRTAGVGGGGFLRAALSLQTQDDTRARRLLAGLLPGTGRWQKHEISYHSEPSRRKPKEGVLF